MYIYVYLYEKIISRYEMYLYILYLFNWDIVIRIEIGKIIFDNSLIGFFLERLSLVLFFYM